MSSILPILTNNENIEKLETLLANANTHTTFWGGRYITIEKENKTHFFSIGYFSKYLIDQAYNCVSNNGSLDKAHRIQGHKIVEKLENFNNVTKDKIKKSNFIKRFFNYFREGINVGANLFYAKDLFSSYSVREFEQQKKNQSDLPSNRFIIIRGINRIIIEEESNLF
jgi:hypothetical protein